LRDSATGQTCRVDRRLPAGGRQWVQAACRLAGATLVLLTLTGLATTRPSTTALAAPAPTTTLPASHPPVAPATTAVKALQAGGAPPSTVPLDTRQPSAHVSPVFPILSAMGAVLVVIMLGTQWLLTRPGRRGWTL
jgi:hypothetical protein